MHIINTSPRHQLQPASGTATGRGFSFIKRRLAWPSPATSPETRSIYAAASSIWLAFKLNASTMYILTSSCLTLKAWLILSKRVCSSTKSPQSSHLLLASQKMAPLVTLQTPHHYSPSGLVSPPKIRISFIPLLNDLPVQYTSSL